MFIQHNWDILNDPGVPCPLGFSYEEMDFALEEAERWGSYEDCVESLFKLLGVGLDGKVDEVQKFELVKRKSDELPDKWDVEAPGGPYPFQDGGRSFVPV